MHPCGLHRCHSWCHLHRCSCPMAKLAHPTCTHRASSRPKRKVSMGLQAVGQDLFQKFAIRCHAHPYFFVHAYPGVLLFMALRVMICLRHGAAPWKTFVVVHSNRSTDSFVILVDVALPAGLSLTPSSGAILGTPTVEGLFALNFSAQLLSTGGFGLRCTVHPSCRCKILKLSCPHCISQQPC